MLSGAQWSTIIEVANAIQYVLEAGFVIVMARFAFVVTSR
jgi:hypothetical protein